MAVDRCDRCGAQAYVRVTLPAGGGWLSGEHVRASVHVDEKTALVAPRVAVLPEDEGQVLYTVKDSKAVKHVVEVGITSDSNVEVSGKDLKPGDPVVVVGNYELEDGMAVTLPGSESNSAGDQAKPAAEKKP